MSEEIHHAALRGYRVSVWWRGAAPSSTANRARSAPAFGRSSGFDDALDGTVRSAIGPTGQKRFALHPSASRVVDGTHVWGEPDEGVMRRRLPLADRCGPPRRGGAARHLGGAARRFGKRPRTISRRTGFTYWDAPSGTGARPQSLEQAADVLPPDRSTTTRPLPGPGPASPTRTRSISTMASGPCRATPPMPARRRLH